VNYHGSYRRLLQNSISAFVSAIEIYNKPKFFYREECFVILLLNSYELLFKALLSRKGQSIFYRKKYRQPYRTLSLNDAFNKAQRYFPDDIDPLPIRKNLDLLSTYRDNAVHFYNQKGFEVVIYALAQTAIINYKDLLLRCFGKDLADEINWALLPIGTSPPVDPIQYISSLSATKSKTSPAVSQFISELKSSIEEVEKLGKDIGRVVTIFEVKLESVKKITAADIVIGVERSQDKDGPLAIVKTIDPNVSHPLRRKDIVLKIGHIHGIKFTSYVFDAVVWRYNLKADPIYCWKATEGILTRYSPTIITRIKQLSKNDVVHAIEDYRERMRKKRCQNN